MTQLFKDKAEGGGGDGVCVYGKKRQVFTGLGFLPLPSFLLFQIPSLKEELHILCQTPGLSAHTQRHLDDPTTNI